MRKAIITLLTDFGTKDHYVASMKGAILSINPDCTLVDISHEVTPQDIEEGAFILANASSFFPKGAIHVAVVDPGVGGPRRPILLATSNYFFIGPDNGLFTLALRRERRVEQAVALTNRKFFLPAVSSTFHGRDLFAPVAAHLSLGIEPKAFGEEIRSYRKLGFRRPRVKGAKLVGEVLHTDAFGNLITNIDEEKFLDFTKRRPFMIEIAEKTIRGLKRGYWSGKKGEAMGLFGSSGFLEISIREGNAREVLRVKKGDPIQISAKEEVWV